MNEKKENFNKSEIEIYKNYRKRLTSTTNINIDNLHELDLNQQFALIEALGILDDANNDSDQFHITPGTGGVPVHMFIEPNDPEVIKIVEKYNSNIDLIFNWISNNIEFVSDIDATRRFDKWNYPGETIRSGTADCEDASILYVSLLIRCGRTAHCVLGEIFDSSWFWHVFVEYFNDEVGEWIYLEPTSKNPYNIPWKTFKIHGLVSQNGFYPNLDREHVFFRKQFSTSVLVDIKNKIYC